MVHLKRIDEIVATNKSKGGKKNEEIFLVLDGIGIRAFYV